MKRHAVDAVAGRGLRFRRPFDPQALVDGVPMPAAVIAAEAPGCRNAYVDALRLPPGLPGRYAGTVLHLHISLEARDDGGAAPGLQ